LLLAARVLRCAAFIVRCCVFECPVRQSDLGNWLCENLKCDFAAIVSLELGPTKTGMGNEWNVRCERVC
jgi:hypothetical protein